MNTETMFDPSVPLATATVQDIHLELMRRSEHNAFHGARVLADLLAHRQDWQAVLFDTYGLATDRGLPASSSYAIWLITTTTRIPSTFWRSMRRRRTGSPLWQRRGGLSPISTVRKTLSARSGRAAPSSAWFRCGGINALHRRSESP
jgi:hypothetical protein